MMTYAFDLGFLHDRGVETVELKSPDGQARVLTVPSWQGRVMTSSSRGLQGRSYGWINHDFIASLARSPQFNNWGGEERFWLGPEGGDNSWYFAPGAEQTFPRWKVPSPFDTDEFAVTDRTEASVVFSREVTLSNARGREFRIGMKRSVELLGPESMEALTGHLPQGAAVVAYTSRNSITNLGSGPWNETSGMPSVWMLGMLMPSDDTIVFVPYNTAGEGRIVKDDYFGKIPDDRMEVRDGFVLLRADGRYRSKLGISAGRTLGLVGACDPVQGLLTILKTDIPAPGSRFVNSQWGRQEDAFGGDALNAYNDGPTEDGTVMGPFYEVETSSPAAALSSGETLVHTQTTIHVEAPAHVLREVIARVFGSCPI